MTPNRNAGLPIHPEMLAVMYARARRARAQAIHNLAVRLIQKLTPRLNVRLWDTHWG